MLTNRPAEVPFLDPETLAALAEWESRGSPETYGLPASLEAQETTPDPLTPPGAVDRSNGHPLETQSSFQRAAHSAFSNERWQVVNALWQPEAPDELAKRAQRMGQCCCMPSIRVDQSGNVAPSLSRCRDRLCPLCSQRRGRQAAMRTCLVVAKFNAPRFITLTLAHRNEPLGATFTRLHECIRQLREQRFWRKAVRGGVFGFEVTRNTKRGEWHVHVHIIVDGEFIPHANLKAAWHLITGDSFIVDVRAIPNRNKAANYISRYVAKPMDLSSWLPSDLREYAAAMHGKRLLQTFGTAHNVPVDDDVNDSKAEGTSHLCTAQELQAAVARQEPKAQKAAVLLARMGRDYATLVGTVWATTDTAIVPEPAEMAELIDTLRSIGDPFPCHRPDSGHPRQPAAGLPRQDDPALFTG